MPRIRFYLHTEFRTVEMWIVSNINSQTFRQDPILISKGSREKSEMSDLSDLEDLADFSDLSDSSDVSDFI